MTSTTTTPSFALVPSVETAWQDVDSSFERFCLTAGIGAIEQMLSRSATPLDTDVAPQIQKLVATPIAEMERLIAELQQAKTYLQSECERLEQETARYVSLTQLASETTTVISDSISQWHPARSDQRS